MDHGAVADVRNGFAQDFVGQGSRVSLAKEKKPDNVGDRIPFLPFEVDVRDATGQLSMWISERRDGIRNDGTARIENAMVVQSFPLRP